MKAKFFAATALTAVLMATSASALVQTITINTTVTSDNFGNTGGFFGNTGTATITYDDDNLVLGFGNFIADAPANGLAGLFPEFDFTLTMFGQTFTQVNDPDSFFGVVNGTAADWSLSISRTDAQAPTAISNSLLNGFSIISSGTNLTQTGPNTFSADVFVNDLAATVVPLPASVLFLGAALGGLGVASRRRTKTAA